MALRLEAIYEQGILRLLSPLNLSEGAKVEIIVVEKHMGWDAKDAAETLLRIAALPQEGETSPISEEDHDKIIYGV